MNLKLPAANRIVAFAGPYISLLSGAVASWLVVNVQVLGSLHLGQDKLAHGIAYAVTAGLGAGLPHLGMQKWLNGHQAYFGKVFDLVNLLDPGAQRQVAAALPGVNGDILAALTTAIKGPALAQEPKTSAPIATDASEVDTSGDEEEPNGLIDIEAPPLDELPPAATFGDDAVHAPAGVEIAPPAQEPPPPQQATPGGAAATTDGGAQ